MLNLLYLFYADICDGDRGQQREFKKQTPRRTSKGRTPPPRVARARVGRGASDAFRLVTVTESYGSFKLLSPRRH
jgi:hypothetical protein